MSYPNTDIDKISVELSSEAKKYAEKAAALATDPYFREARCEGFCVRIRLGALSRFRG
jgi:hypothetical protein